MSTKRPTPSVHFPVLLGCIFLFALGWPMGAEEETPDSSASPAASKKNANELGEYLESYREGAEAGVPRDQYDLGASYRWGVEAPRNLILAAQWIRKAAEKGYPLAERTLGEMYEKGEGVVPSEVEALRWYKLAARHGDRLAEDAVAALDAKLRPAGKTTP